jgi:GNAT superfamily N-acetyltransferase
MTNTKIFKTGEIEFSTDKARLDIAFIHNFLSNESYWSKGIPISVVERSIENSMAIGIYKNSSQIGFARVITDYATFAYLADVFIDSRHRGNGIAKQLIQFILTIDELTQLRRFILATADAHTLYSKFGFKQLKLPHRFMEIHKPDIYQQVGNEALK